MKGKFIRAATIVLAIALAASGCKRMGMEDRPEQKVSGHIERAESYRQQGQYRAAIIEARNAIDAAPSDIRGIVELATLLNDLNQGKQALHILEPIADNPNRGVVLARTDALLAQGKFRSALEYVQARPHDDPDMQLRLAEAQAGLGQIAQAEALLVALENSTHAMAAKVQLVRLHLQQGDNEAASAKLKEILLKEPNRVEALMLSAKLAEMAGDLENAEALLSRALINLPQTDIITPQKAGVLQQLMPILTKLGRSNESLIYAKVLADADPQGAILQSKFKQGVEAFKAGDFGSAETLLSEVYEQTHDDYAGILLGMIKYSKKDYGAAAAYLGENADPEIAPDTALKALANAEMRLGRPGKVLEAISADERERIKDPELKALVGIALVQSGNRASGEKMLIDALHSNPGNAAVRATLARHYLLGSETEKAIAVLDEGLAQKFDAALQRLLVGAYLNAGKSDAALQAARKLAATTPEQAVNYYVLGHTALLTQQFDLTETALQKALVLQADYVPALLDSARLLLIRQQPQAAAAIYQRLIASNDSNIEAIKGFITAEEASGVDASGDNMEKRVLQLSHSETAHAIIAEYYLRNQRRADAERQLANMAGDTENGYVKYVKQLYALAEASAFLRTKEYSRASEVAIAGLQLNPRNPDLLALLTRSEIEAGSTNEAEKIIEQFAQVAPQSPALLDLRASLALAKGDSATATQQLRTLWNNLKTDQTANKLYQTLLKTDAATAAQFLAEWQTALPNSDNPLLLQAVQLERNGNLVEAQKQYEATLQRNGNNSLAMNNLALLYANNKDPRGLALAEKAYSLQPDNPAVLDTLGWMLVTNNQRTRGIELLKKAAGIAPNSKEIADHLQQAQNSK